MTLVTHSFFYALALISVQALFLTIKFALMFDDKKVFSSLNYRDALGSYFSIELLQFFIVTVAIHTSFLLLALNLHQYVKHSSKLRPALSRLLFISLFFFIVIFSNSILFPHSSFSLDSKIPTSIVFLLFFIIFISILDFKKINTASINKNRLIFSFIVIIILLLSMNFSQLSFNNKTFKENKNIIVFSIDSLRPDATTTSEHSKSIAPFISKQLQNSHNFTQAYTPLARTFPAWMSVLTGQQPIHHKAEFNLTDPERFKGVKTLAHTLQDNNYYTIYASDEKRFANITPELGFDQVFGPPYGLADFILGTFADIPLLNLATLLPAAEYILPYSTLNRASPITYNPENFSDYLINKISLQKENSGNKPLFLAFHFCLPHHPFSWRTSIDTETSKEAYANTVAMADKQVAAVYKALKSMGIINNLSTQIIMSDHGETLPSDIKDFTWPNGKKETLTGFGHGTSSKQISQHHVVLGIQHPTLPAKNDFQLASLIDIAPTLLQLLSISPSNHANFDGINLFSEHKPARHWLSFETGYNVSAIKHSKLNEADIFQQAAHAYRITVQGKVIIKNEIYPELLDQKQYSWWNGHNLITRQNDALINYNWKDSTAKPHQEKSKLSNGLNSP